MSNIKITSEGKTVHINNVDTYFGDVPEKPTSIGMFPKDTDRTPWIQPNFPGVPVPEEDRSWEQYSQVYVSKPVFSVSKEELESFITFIKEVEQWKLNEKSPIRDLIKLFDRYNEVLEKMEEKFGTDFIKLFLFKF